MIIRVRDDNSVVIWDSDVMWMFQLALFIATGAKFADKCAIWLENLWK